jgi:hypothetical protein
MGIKTLWDTIRTCFLGVPDADADGVAGSGSLVELAFELEGVVSSTLVCCWRDLSMARFFVVMSHDVPSSFRVRRVRKARAPGRPEQERLQLRRWEEQRSPG